MTKFAIVIFTVVLVCCSIGILADSNTDSNSNTNTNDNYGIDSFSDGFQKMGEQLGSDFQNFNPLKQFSSYSSKLSSMYKSVNGKPVVDQVDGYSSSNVNGKKEEHEFHN